jgi:flavin reductase (DIM6/NTAB) family NADH-FMN oxidoreductase RutF
MISLGANTFVPVAPVWVVGTYDHDGRPNAMTAAWGGICCSKPPCVYVSLRKATYTYGNLLERKAFTVNFPSEEYVKETDYFGLVSGRDSDKFLATNLTPVKSDLVDAPYVKEFPMVLECKVIKVIEIGLHTEFIGEIVDAKAQEGVLDANKLPDVRKLKPLVWSLTGISYCRVGEDVGKSFSIGKQVIKKKSNGKQKKALNA